MRRAGPQDSGGSLGVHTRPCPPEIGLAWRRVSAEQSKICWILL